MTNTPDPRGYLAAWAVSAAVYAAIFAIGTSLRDGTGAGTALGVFVIYGYGIGAVSIPFALVGVGLVHLTCRRVRHQAVHVVAAGLAGAPPAGFMVAVDPQAGAWLWWLIPVATAIGRASVVPLVQRRRDADVRGARAAS
ncbi:MAG TPA: hypothetical protein VN088_01585 [Nocardioides sp.]|nr:hypothetical protein [Nocardioides sp.]